MDDLELILQGDESLFDYHYERFTPHQKKKVLKFLSSLSLETRKRLSASGVDPPGIYSAFKDNWRSTVPICLYHGKEVIALAKLSEWRDGVYLSCLVVRDDLQGEGFGSRLVTYLFALATLNGYKKIYAEVKTDNLEGILFFQKMGFKIKEEGEITYLMERKIR